jgi:hypothetical protein
MARKILLPLQAEKSKTLFVRSWLVLLLLLRPPLVVVAASFITVNQLPCLLLGRGRLFVQVVLMKLNH